MARASQPKPDGRFCPFCKATLCLSAKRFIYCPNRYRVEKPCPFKGYPAGANTATGTTGEPIAKLETMSDEQRAIVERCDQWTKG